MHFIDPCGAINSIFSLHSRKKIVCNTPGGKVGGQTVYLQVAQYCASCNREVMPVLPVNTVPNIGILLAYYWGSTGVVFFVSTGESRK